MSEAILQSVIIGLITGMFSAGAVWGVLKTELHFMRRDLDKAMHDLDSVTKHVFNKKYDCRNYDKGIEARVDP